MKRLFEYKTKFLTRLSVSFLLCTSLISCEDFINVDPPNNQLITATVFEDELTAKAAMLGVYSKMGFGGPAAGAANGISLLSGLSSDELILIAGSGEVLQFEENGILSTNSLITGVWNTYYEYIYYCNSLIEGIDKSTKLSASIRSQFKGEAIFLRAYSHFYLVNLFGKIPYLTSTDYELNSHKPRLEIDEVYDLLVNDLTTAKELMTNDYSFSNGKRTSANSLAASALLSRVYLFMGKNAEAEAEATVVIDNPLFSLEDVENTFLASSRESIWQLANSRPGGSNFTNDGDFFAGGSRFSQSLSENLVSSFEAGDLRRNNWILDLDLNGEPVYAPYKYKVDFTSTAPTETYAVLRLGEQFLIRAEARARQDKIVGTSSAASDLNAIRDRAGLDPVPTMTKDETLDAILIERNHELFTEMGTRWLDLKRKDKTDEILGPIKPDWEATDVLYPIPYEETLVNKNLYQNDGYK
jgi:starch-binding outer membrane protein, SusD/RagB family